MRCLAPLMKPIIVANWKANVNLDMLENLTCNPEILDVAIACPTVYTDDVRKKAKDYIKVCSQDCSKFNEGAYTGETPAKFLKDKGVDCVLIGHSERRKYFNEDSEVLSKKVQHALQAGLDVVYCIGESRTDRESKSHLNVLYNQFFSAIAKDITITIAYEPVWSIGTGILLDPADVEDIVKNIHKWAESINVNVRVIYGGSVGKKTIADFKDIKGLKGYLVGGKSLTDEFQEIVKSYESQIN